MTKSIRFIAVLFFVLVSFWNDVNASEFLYAVETPGSFVRYDLQQNQIDVLRIDIHNTGEQMKSTFDKQNGRLFVYGGPDDNLTILNTLNNSKEIMSNAINSEGSVIEYDKYLNSIFSVETDGSFAKYDLNTNIRTVLRIDMSNLSYDMKSTYDQINTRLFVYSNEYLTILNTETGSKEIIRNAIHSSGSVIEYDPDLNCLFSVEAGGTFAKYDLTTNTRTVFRNDISTRYDMKSTYDSLGKKLFVHSGEYLTILDTMTGEKETVFQQLDENGTVIEYVPEPSSLCLMLFGVLALKKRKLHV